MHRDCGVTDTPMGFHTACTVACKDPAILLPAITEQTEPVMQELVGTFYLILTFGRLEFKILINANEVIYPIIIIFIQYKVLIW